MREERDVPWVNIVNWLQKIFPQFASADFRCLIDRNTETAMSLTGDVRENFLRSNVNFEFVGPICDSIGIGRTDLLEMSDFSDRAKLTDVTNGLILELTNFIEREKIDPVVLVLWLRNFDSMFCSDGKIQKANRLLQSSLKNFRIQLRNNQRSRNRSSGLFDDFLQSPFELDSDLDDPEYGRVTVMKGHKRKRRPRESSPRRRLRAVQEESNFQTPRIKEECEPIDISEHNLSSGESGNKCNMEVDCVPDSYQEPLIADVKEEPDPQSISSKPEHVQTPDSEENPRTDTGDCVTLLDAFFLSLQKLTEVFGSMNETAEKVSLDLLNNRFTLMLREDSEMKYLNEKIVIHSLSEKDQSVVPPLSFLQQTTYFFFEIVKAVEGVIVSFEREIVTNTGDKLGRDNNPRFRSFLNFNESAVTRYIKMACEILCPRGEFNNGYRRHWLAFCIERNNPSKLPINQSNRFLNYFEAAAGLVHHHEDVALFVSDLQQMNDDSNILLDSVSDDASDEAIQTLVCVVAVVYCKVLGPFWQLLKSEAQYLLYSKYIFLLYKKLLRWSQDVSLLLQPEPVANVFLQVPMQEKNFSGVFTFCQENEDNQYGTLLRVCLEKLMKVLAAVIEEVLPDFLPGGTYAKEPSEELGELLSDCTFSKLMGEYPFGHSCPLNKNRPDRTSVQEKGIVAEESLRPPTAMPLEKSTSAQIPKGLRPLDKTKLKKLMEQRQRAQKQEQLDRKVITATVAENGGPCKSVEDVDRLLLSMEGAHHSQKRSAIRSELARQLGIVGSTFKKPNYLGFSLIDMVTKLKSILASEKSSESTTTEPTTNVLNVEGNENQSSTTTDTPEPQEPQEPTTSSLEQSP